VRIYAGGDAGSLGIELYAGESAGIGDGSAAMVDELEQGLP
jgi:hypothetical protein